MKLVTKFLVLLTVLTFLGTIGLSELEFNNALENNEPAVNYRYSDTVEQFNESSERYKPVYLYSVEDLDVVESNGVYSVDGEISVSEFGEYFINPPGKWEDVDNNELINKLENDGYRFEGGDFDVEAVETLREELENPTLEVTDGEEVSLNTPPAMHNVDPQDSYNFNVELKSKEVDDSFSVAQFQLGENTVEFTVLQTLDDATSNVESVDWSNGYLASGSRDDNVYIYDTSDWSLDETLDDATNTVSSVDWSSDGNYLATGSNDDNVYIYDTSDWSLVETLEDATSYVYSVAWSSGGDYLASGGRDDNVYIYDTSDWSLIETLEDATATVNSVAWSNDYLATGSLDENVYVYETIVSVPPEIIHTEINPDPIQLNEPHNAKIEATHPDEENIVEATVTWYENKEEQASETITPNSDTVNHTFEEFHTPTEFGEHEILFYVEDENELSNEQTIIRSVDAETPEATKINPQDEEIFNDREVLFEFEIESFNAPVNSVDLIIDDDVETSFEGFGSETTKTFDYQKVFDEYGDYDWELEVFYETGNSFTTDAQSFELELEEPVINLENPVDGAEVSILQDTEFEFFVETFYEEIDEITLEVRNETTNDVLLSEDFGGQNSSTNETYTFNYDFDVSGFYEWDVTVDFFGEETVSETRSFEVLEFVEPSGSLIQPLDDVFVEYSGVRDTLFQLEVDGGDVDGDVTAYLNDSEVFKTEYDALESNQLFEFTEELEPGYYEWYVEMVDNEENNVITDTVGFNVFEQPDTGVENIDDGDVFLLEEGEELNLTWFVNGGSFDGESSILVNDVVLDTQNYLKGEDNQVFDYSHEFDLDTEYSVKSRADDGETDIVESEEVNFYTISSESPELSSLSVFGKREAADNHLFLIQIVIVLLIVGSLISLTNIKM